jgi:hypothetical protein
VITILYPKNFSKKYSQFEKAPTKMFCSPVLGRKWLKDIGSKEYGIISLPGAPTVLASALTLGVFIGR